MKKFLLSILFYLSPGYAQMIPQPVAESAQQVLRVHTTGIAVAFVLDTSSKQASRADEETFRSVGAPFISEQIEFCRRSHIKSCAIYTDDTVGTAFFLSEPGNLISNYHIFHQVIADGFSLLPDNTEVSHLLQALTSVPLFFRAYNSIGMEVISSVNGSSSVKVRSLNPSVKYLISPDPGLFKDLQGQLSDLVQLAIRPVPQRVNVLPLATIAPNPGDDLYAVGYPEIKTGNGVQVGSLSISAGHALAVEDLMKMMNGKEAAKLTDLRRRFLIYADFPCSEGNSGGPILNSRGEVVGVVSGWYENIKTHKVACYGVNLMNLPELKAHWEMVNRKAIGERR